MIMTLNQFCAENRESDTDSKMGKKTRASYRKIARELYGNRGVQAISNAETEHEASRILHDLRMGVC